MAALPGSSPAHCSVLGASQSPAKLLVMCSCFRQRKLSKKRGLVLPLVAALWRVDFWDQIPTDLVVNSQLELQTERADGLVSVNMLHRPYAVIGGVSH